MIPHTIITVGRQFGSGGRDVGFAVAEALGIAFYDRKLIAEISRKSGLTDQAIEKMDERLPDRLRHALSLGYEFGGFSDETIFKLQAETIREIAAQESCVIVGRGADFILRDFPGLYRTFIHSPLEDRIERVMARGGYIDRKQAADQIEKTDRKRSGYYNFYTGKKWGAAASYDITIDSSILGVEQTAKTICRFVEAALAR